MPKSSKKGAGDDPVGQVKLKYIHFLFHTFDPRNEVSGRIVITSIFKFLPLSYH